jgi:hypothetical protein
MHELATIAFDQSDYEPRLRELLADTGIDPQEFESLEYFGLLPFFVLAGASVRTQVHGHGDHVHFESVVLEVPEDLVEAFYGTLPDMLEQAYGDPAGDD